MLFSVSVVTFKSVLVFSFCRATYVLNPET